MKTRTSHNLSICIIDRIFKKSKHPNKQKNITAKEGTPTPKSCIILSQAQKPRETMWSVCDSMLPCMEHKKATTAQPQCLGSQLCWLGAWSLRSPTDLDFWELHNFRKDFDAVGVSNHCVHAPAIHDRCRDGFQFVPTDINFFKFLQFCHFTKRNGWENHQLTIRQL